MLLLSCHHPSLSRQRTREGRCRAEFSPVSSRESYGKRQFPVRVNIEQGVCFGNCQAVRLIDPDIVDQYSLAVRLSRRSGWFLARFLAFQPSQTTLGKVVVSARRSPTKSRCAGRVQLWANSRNIVSQPSELEIGSTARQTFPTSVEVFRL